MAKREDNKVFSENRLDCSTLEAFRNSKLVIPGLKGRLFPFQERGVLFLESKYGRGLIADQPGLGKTIQTLAWLQKHPELRPAVIVVPASVKLNWKREACAWMPHPHVRVLPGKCSKDLRPGTSIFIINYDVLANREEKFYICPACKKENSDGKCHNCAFVPKAPLPLRKREIRETGWIDPLCRLHCKVVVVDEVHFIKSRDAKRTKAVRRLCKRVPCVIALSGTPIVNRPIEIFTTLSIVQPNLFPSRWYFAKRYCGLKKGFFGWDFSGATNTKELHEKLTESIMIRRLKKDVLPELPAKTRTVVPMELTNPRNYRRAEQDFIGWLGQFDSEGALTASNAEALTRIEGLKQLAVTGKLEHCIKWIEDFLQSDEKLVVFCTHRKTVAAIQVAFATCASMVYGSQTAKNRQISIDNFQNSEMYRLIVCNIKAGGIGINLHAASNVAFVELGWTPGEMDQAEDRVHRIGQTASSVNAWYLLAANTIEEEIAALLDKKRKVLSQVLDGKDVDEGSMLADLLDKYKKEK